MGGPRIGIFESWPFVPFVLNFMLSILERERLFILFGRRSWQIQTQIRILAFKVY